MNLLLLLLALAPAPARAAEPALTFMSGDAVVLRVTAADLRARPGTKVVSLSDSFYEGRRKRYRATPLKNLLAAAYGPAWKENPGEFIFEALDGYRSHAKAALLAEDGAFIAFEDMDVPSWETIKRQKAKPGPFYLVWAGAQQTPKKGYPWPWQISSVKPARVEDEFSKAVPAAKTDAAVAAGWALFKYKCISCHAMSGSGGNLGPDLNEPRGITRYHDKEELKAFIHKASSFRHTKMPDFDELTPSNLDDLMAYFDSMSEQAGTK